MVPDSALTMSTGELIQRAAPVLDPTSLDVAEIVKRQDCSDQNIQGNGNTQTCGTNNTVGGDGDTENVSTSHGISQSDKIAIGVGVGGGIIAIVGVVLTYIGIRRKRESSGQISSVPQPELSQPSGSSWHQRQSSYRPFGRPELHE